MPPRSPRSLLKLLFRRGSAFALLVLLLVFVTLEQRPYDDAYFFLRVAGNALEHGTLAWNVGEAPVYGITTQLFLLPVLALVALSGDYALFATRLFLALCLVLAYAISARPSPRAGLPAAVAFASPVALFSVLSGMETALAILLVALALDLLMRDRARGSAPLGRADWAPGAALLAAWLARPDTLLLLVPSFTRYCIRRGRRGAWQALAVGLGFAGFLLFFRLYYGTALPLPFYAKQAGLSPYDAEFLALAKTTQLRHFGLFVLTALPLFVVALLRRDSDNALLVTSVLLFAGYHALGTVDIMGMHARFFAPALPLLVRAAERARERRHPPRSVLVIGGVYLALLFVLARPELLPSPELPSDHRVPLAYYGVSVLAALLLFFSIHQRRFTRVARGILLSLAGIAIVASHGFKLRPPQSDSAYLDAHERRGTVFRGLSTLRTCFGDRLSVYHSEVGVPGLRFAHGRVVDLAGLFNPDWLFGKRGFDELCEQDRPEAIFLPHRNYREYNRRVQESRCLENYVRVVAESAAPLYVRRDLAERYTACESLRAFPPTSRVQSK